MSRKQPSILSFFNKDGRSVITHVVNNSDTETSLIGEEPAAGAVTGGGGHVAGGAGIVGGGHVAVGALTGGVGHVAGTAEVEGVAAGAVNGGGGHVAGAAEVEGAAAEDVAGDGGVGAGAGHEGPVHGRGERHVKWANTREIMSLAEICQNVHNWYDPNYGDDISGNRSTVLARKQKLPPTFQKDFPYALIIKVSDILKFSPQHFETGELFEEHLVIDEEGNK
jgi:hypothetical protein